MGKNIQSTLRIGVLIIDAYFKHVVIEILDIAVVTFGIFTVIERLVVADIFVIVAAVLVGIFVFVVTFLLLLCCSVVYFQP